MSTALTNGIHVLSDHEIMRNAPAVYADEHSDNLSDKYEHYRTYQIIDNLRDMGWECWSAKQDKVYKKNQLPNANCVATHSLRFARPADLDNIDKCDIFPNIVLYNSHNGRTSLSLQAGIFRVVCANGLVIPSVEGQVVTMRNKHLGINNTEELVMGRIDEILRKQSSLNEIVDRMKSVSINKEKQLNYAKKMAQLAYGEQQGNLYYSQLLKPRRPEDEGDSVWNVYNVVQENITKGGIKMKRTTRPVNNIYRDKHLNELLWSDAYKLAVA